MEKALAAWFLLAVSPVSAGSPTQIVQSAIERVVQVLLESDTMQPGVVERRRAEVRRIAERLFDFPEMARRSLARHWSDRTPLEREEFARLLRDLVERSYLARIEAYSSERLVYGPETIEGELATVRSRIQAGRRGEVAVYYRLHVVGGRWTVFDVLVDGVSLVASYRSQFDRVIQSSSYDALVRRLRQRELEAPVVEPASR